MNSNKEIERTELHKNIWRIANDLRGAVDGWDFKSYVLGMLFYRFISGNLTGYLNEQERRAGAPNFDYARLSDSDAESGRSETVREKGILPSELFVNLRARARHDVNLNERLWRSLKYEAVYLRELADGPAAEREIGDWFEFYNHARSTLTALCTSIDSGN